jgi:hypothetical protein
MNKVRLAGILAVAAVTVAAAPAVVGAQAATLTGTRIVFSPPGETVSYLDRQVTFAGTLETAVPSGQVAQVLPDEPVQVTFDPGVRGIDLPIADVTTDANGQFTVTTTVPVPGLIVATFAGDASYRAGIGEASAHVAPGAAALPARITFGPVAPAPAYSTVTVAGQVSMQLPDGTWVPSPYAPVEPIGGTDVSWQGLADADGQFTETFKAFPGSPLQMYTSAYGGDWSGDAFSPDLFVPLTTLPTQAQDVTPSEVSVTANMTLNSVVQYMDDTGQWQPAPGATAQLAFQPGCSGGMVPAATAVGAATGLLTFHVPGYLVHGAPDVGCWQVRVPQQGAYLASRSDDVRVTADIPVSLNNVKLRWSRGRAWLSGTLDRAVGRTSLAHRLITVYLGRGRGWTRVGPAVRTGASGSFSFSLAGWPRGYYQARFAGSPFPGGGYDGVNSKRVWYRG